MSIRAIETSYKGYHFRSRLEARWAVFFDTLGIRWEYEPEGFMLPSGGYLPDFYLPDDELWIEIKPSTLTNETFFKARQFRDYSGNAIFVGIGDPLHQTGMLFCWDLGDGSAGSSDWDNIFFTAGKVGGELSIVLCGNFRNKSLYAKEDFSVSFYLAEDGFVDLSGNRFERAAIAARSARFEHGQQGARP